MPRIGKFFLENKAIFRWSFLAAVVLFFATYAAAAHLKTLYASQISAIIRDRTGAELQIKPNAKGFVMRPLAEVPPRFAELLLEKEDRLFRYHFGINPWSIIRDGASFLFRGKLRGSSTLTQQLVKNILGNENDRTFANKIKETFYALSLESQTSKDEILSMYANTAYFGNQAEGLEEAARTYFSLPATFLNDTQDLALLATLSSPSERYPGTFGNKKMVAALVEAFGTAQDGATPQTNQSVSEIPDQSMFEMKTLGVSCMQNCALTIDKDLTQKLRAVIARDLHSGALASAKNAAIVVIKTGADADELLAAVGSEDPSALASGAQINMAIAPRPIGSTAKPFFYAKAFEKGARPYTLVDDREYKYEIGTGFPFYPKNFDGKYRGTVSLHEALSNSLNVPSVKVLEYAGLDNFYDFLEGKLGFKPRQPLANYELGIALGELEMDLATLTNYYSIFPNSGVLKPLRVYADTTMPFVNPPMDGAPPAEERVLNQKYVELVNKILSDRDTGVEQFGIKSSLNLPATNYALKTGTSRDFHDSWTVGYTPDFLVGVWVGNSDNTAMVQVSGQTGAGKLWHEAMEIMLNSPYNKQTQFTFPDIVEYTASGTIDYGLPHDDFNSARMLMYNVPLMADPHDGDIILLEPKTKIPLRANEPAFWSINDIPFGNGTELMWHPVAIGAYTIRAKGANRTEEARVFIRASEEKLPQ